MPLLVSPEIGSQPAFVASLPARHTGEEFACSRPSLPQLSIFHLLALLYFQEPPHWDIFFFKERFYTGGEGMPGSCLLCPVGGTHPCEDFGLRHTLETMGLDKLITLILTPPAQTY